LLKKPICVVVFVARNCGVQKSTPHSLLLGSSHLELFEQPVAAVGLKLPICVVVIKARNCGGTEKYASFLDIRKNI